MHLLSWPRVQLHAFLYDPGLGIANRSGVAARRRRLIAGARGRVLEVGGGTGRNLPLYRDVDGVTVLDVAPGPRTLDRVAAAAVPVELHERTLHDSGLPDASFDTIVCTLVLCTVADQSEALVELRRLLEPERGRMLFLEHVRAPAWRGLVQSALTPVWARLGAGCHLDRDTLDAIRAAGFVITDCDRSGVLVQGIAQISKRQAPATGDRR